ncbi:uncharacterized protein CPUR_01808 [Claviceps purpurea 20.1]|uniref:Uncharacterized protein n=1 Tax=Claviceps purpurea (strain 20.1) TaxID=1111077 RepID=M1W798_CLAP2|nr:uncharacterized protein CPUR_01808 [Claviceps purpurea 20.1]
MPPAIATPTTATTALSRPYLVHQRPLHASHTPMPAAALQQQHQPQQRQLPVFLPSIAPAGAVAEFAKPTSAPASSVKQSRASFNGWVVATPATTTAIQAAGPSP